MFLWKKDTYIAIEYKVGHTSFRILKYGLKVNLKFPKI